MKIDKKLHKLPFTKSNPETLIALFGESDITPMWVADMDFEVAKPIQKALKKRISNSGFAYEYKPSSFFLAQSNWYKNSYNINLIKEQILYSPTITTTISAVIESFTSEKNGIIIQPPVFMEFRDIIRKTKRRIVKNPLKFVNNYYEIDFEDLAIKAQNENNKILILCNPHNPVGRVWKNEELIKIISICKQNNLILISDEIHKDIVLFNNKFTSILNFVNEWSKIVVCTSEAKTFNLCAILDSLAIIPNDEIRNEVASIFKKYNLGRTNALSRVALETAYLKGNVWLNELIKIIENNVKSIENELIGTKIKLIKPEGTYQVWLDFSAIFNDSKEMFNFITQRAKVGLNAGHWFGREGALFMRMNIATSNKKVIKAIKKIKKAVNNY
jgi:putative C-S lyase